MFTRPPRRPLAFRKKLDGIPRAAPSLSEKVSCIFGPLRLVIAVPIFVATRKFGVCEARKTAGGRQALQPAPYPRAVAAIDVPELALETRWSWSAGWWARSSRPGSW